MRMAVGPRTGLDSGDKLFGIDIRLECLRGPWSWRLPGSKSTAGSVHTGTSIGCELLLERFHLFVFASGDEHAGDLAACIR